MADIGTTSRSCFWKKYNNFFCVSHHQEIKLFTVSWLKKNKFGFEAHFKNQSRGIPVKYLILIFLSIPNHHNE